MDTKNMTRIKALEKLIDSGLSQVDALNVFAKRRTPSEEKLVENARLQAQYVAESCDCQIEIDDNALVSCEDDGHRGWVMAWLRVDGEDESEES
jgi:hypothetical protein